MHGRRRAIGGAIAIAAICLSFSRPIAAQTNQPQIAPDRHAAAPVAAPELLDAFVSHQSIEPDVARALKALTPRLKTELKDGNGWLLYVEIFTDAGDNKHAGRTRPVEILAQGTTPSDAALNYYLISDLPPPAPAGLLFDEKLSYVLWVTRNSGDIAFAKTSYPFSGVILDTGSRAAELALTAARSATPVRAEIQPLKKPLEDIDRELQKQAAIRLALQAQLQQSDWLAKIAEQRKGEITAQIAREQLRAEAGQRRPARTLSADQQDGDQRPFDPPQAPQIAAIRVPVRQLVVPTEFAPPAEPRGAIAQSAYLAGEAPGTDLPPADAMAVIGRPRLRPLAFVRPEYPAGAEGSRIEGYVDFAFTINRDGTVGQPKVLAEIPQGVGFADAASAALLKWRFSPTIADGEPVETPASFRFTFKLKR
jgi:TonB family protein